MHQQKRICFRLTANRIYDVMVVVFSAVNLAIVGVAFNLSFSTAMPAMASGSIDISMTATFLVPTSTEGETVAMPSVATSTFTLLPSATLTPTRTNTATQTASFTPTVTFTHTPSVTPCLVPYLWPTYIVQRGDTLSHIAQLTGSTVKELMQVNCLMDTLIFSGQRFYVPRLPLPTSTATAMIPNPLCLDFEDLKPGITYQLGETFASKNMPMSVGLFTWKSSAITREGIVYIDATQQAGGFGMEVQINNANVLFYLPNSSASLSLLFGEYGGNVNISVNDDFRNVDNFADLQGLNIGGVVVSVLQGSGNAQGYLHLAGKVYSFAIGGQELAIDNVCMSQ